MLALWERSLLQPSNYMRWNWMSTTLEYLQDGLAREIGQYAAIVSNSKSELTMKVFV